jgi:cytochrome c-type biogenesis protein CcmE
VKKQRQFLLVGTLLVGVIAYLLVTGMTESAMYYYMPDELLSAVQQDPTKRELGFKVGGRVVPGTVRYDQRTLELTFEVVNMKTGQGRIPVHYQGPLPDTFQEGRDVVVTGKLTAGNRFEASEVLTKCGSRYEAAEEELRRS